MPGRALDVPGDPLSNDCGGDCVACMAGCGDPDCVASVVAATGRMPDGSVPTDEDRDRYGLPGRDAGGTGLGDEGGPSVR